VKVVSNAGPLIALGKLGQLGLLLKLYGEILIPREVYNEVVTNGLRLGTSDAQAVDFLIRQGHIRVVEVALPSPLPAWSQPIDAGELEVIVLAQQQSADWVLIDNIHARQAARRFGNDARDQRRPAGLTTLPALGDSTSLDVACLSGCSFAGRKVDFDARIFEHACYRPSRRRAIVC
jgi:predicted nucleic acid-binding protein